MGTTRRGFIRVLGGTTVIIGASAGGFAVTREPSEALAPWKLAGSKQYEDPRMRALSYAILAPNPHNRQPWMVDLSKPGEAILYCDLERLLPQTDPPNRQITIGLGCFLELLRMAAAEEGMTAEITPFPEGANEEALDARPVAHIQFTEGAKRDPLFKHVLARHSNKEPYDTTRVVTDDTLAGLTSVVGDDVGVDTTNDIVRVDQFRALTWAAHYLETTTPRTMQESIDLMRIGKKEINENPDGIELGGFFLEALALAGQLTREKMADPNSVAFKQGLDMFRAIMASGMGYVWVVTETNTRFDQLGAGRAWVRMNLKAGALGLGLHPHSQALQEFPEMADLFDEIHEALGVDPSSGARVQMFGRLGYGPKPVDTPRWRVETRVRGV